MTAQGKWIVEEHLPPFRLCDVFVFFAKEKLRSRGVALSADRILAVAQMLMSLKISPDILDRCDCDALREMSEGDCRVYLSALARYVDCMWQWTSSVMEERSGVTVTLSFDGEHLSAVRRRGGCDVAKAVLAV